MNTIRPVPATGDPAPGLDRRASSDDAAWRWSATAIAHAVRTRRVSAREIAQAHLDRIAATNPAVNALVEVSPDEALAMADAADQAVAAGEPLGPLHGVPVSIKINVDQAGHATTNGVVAFKDEVAPADGPQAAALRRAGAVFVGRSNTPAFSYRWFTDNALHGRTLNPWDATRTPGGSSGGAAAAVAAGLVPIAHGNDIGGSIRHPAYACGVTGIRPTVGRVPGWYGPRQADPALSVQTMLTDGPLARSVADLRLALAAMGGFDARDPLALPGLPAVPAMARPIRVGLLRDVEVARPSPAVNAALDAAAGWLADAGYHVEEVALPQLREAYQLWYLLAMEEFRQILPLVEQVGDAGMRRAAAHYYAVAKDWWGERPDLATYMNGYARRGMLVAQLQQFFEHTPIVLLPVSAEQAFEHDADIASVERMRQVMAAQWSMMAIPLLGMPAVAVPTGIAGGLPVGVQLLGGRWREELLLDAAEVIEARAGTFTPIEPRS